MSEIKNATPPWRHLEDEPEHYQICILSSECGPHQGLFFYKKDRRRWEEISGDAVVLECGGLTRGEEGTDGIVHYLWYWAPVTKPLEPSSTHTFTDAELERLIAVACREQRYKCVDAIKVQENFCTHHTFSGIAQNTPAPTLEQVMEKYKEKNIENE